MDLLSVKHTDIRLFVHHCLIIAWITKWLNNSVIIHLVIKLRKYIVIKGSLIGWWSNSNRSFDYGHPFSIHSVFCADDETLFSSPAKFAKLTVLRSIIKPLSRSWGVFQINWYMRRNSFVLRIYSYIKSTFALKLEYITSTIKYSKCKLCRYSPTWCQFCFLSLRSVWLAHSTQSWPLPSRGS